LYLLIAILIAVLVVFIDCYVDWSCYRFFMVDKILKKSRQDIHNSDVPVVCRACEARHRGICGALSPKQLTELSKYTALKRVKAGTELFTDADRVTTYSNILAGVVKLTKVLADGRQQIVGLQFAPDFMGRPFQSKRLMSAEATGDVSVCSFPKTAIDRLIVESPDLEHRLLEQTLQELDEAREWMVTLGRKSASEKVASFLLLIAIHFNPEALDEEGPITFDLPLRRVDIADFLGVTIETVSRNLTKLRKEGVVEIENNRHFTVPDLSRLEMRAVQ
jgi:CRP/FNR family transcriptional regulator